MDTVGKMDHKELQVSVESVARLEVKALADLVVIAESVDLVDQAYQVTVALVAIQEVDLVVTVDTVV